MQAAAWPMFIISTCLCTRVLKSARSKTRQFSIPSSLQSPYPNLPPAKDPVSHRAASVKNPDPSMADHRARADLLKTLEGDLRKERLSDTLPFWWESLKTAPDTDAAERIVKHVLECPDGRPHVVNEQVGRGALSTLVRAAPCAVVGTNAGRPSRNHLEVLTG